MNDDDERAAITAAMARLFAGTPTRSSGNLDIVTLAQEAGLKRNKLTHRHIDLKDQFYAERAKRAGVSEREIKLQDQITELETRIATLRKERDDYRAANDAFARALHVATVENGNLRKDLANTSGAIVGTVPRTVFLARFAGPGARRDGHCE